MKTINWKRMLILFSIALNIGFAADGLGHFIFERRAERFAQDGFASKGMENAFYHRLDLTAEQHDRIDTQLSAYATRQRELKKVNKQTRRELARLLAGFEESDRPALTELIDRMAAIKREREHLTAEHLLQVKAVLSPQQAEDLFERLMKVMEGERE